MSQIPLSSPEDDCYPPDCSLHLHVGTTEYAMLGVYSNDSAPRISDYTRLGVYSTDSAPGIIVAHGEGGRKEE